MPKYTVYHIYFPSGSNGQLQGKKVVAQSRALAEAYVRKELNVPEDMEPHTSTNQGEIDGVVE